jgi:hypothetical protein
MMPDTTGVEVNDFPPIDSDWYDLVFSDSEEKEDKNGDDYGKLTFTIEDGKRRAWCNLSYKPDFLWKVKQFKIAIGAADTDTDLARFHGTRLKGYVENETYKGKNYPRVNEFKPFDDQTATPPQNPADDKDLPF